MGRLNTSSWVFWQQLLLGIIRYEFIGIHVWKYVQDSSNMRKSGEPSNTCTKNSQGNGVVDYLDQQDLERNVG